MTTTQTPAPVDWTRALSMHDLYIITSNTTDRRERDEAMAEIQRRDDEADAAYSEDYSCNCGHPDCGAC